MWVEFWYNTSFHTTTKHTPYQIVYSRDPPPILHFDKGLTTNSSVKQFLLDQNEILRELKAQLSKAQLRMKQMANGYRHDIQFEVGDSVHAPQTAFLPSEICG